MLALLHVLFWSGHDLFTGLVSKGRSEASGRVITGIVFPFHGSSCLTPPDLVVSFDEEIVLMEIEENER